EVIASLPLADGYSLSFRNFDVMKQKPQIKQLKVVGTESVTVPAGTFDAYKLEIVAADNDADKQTVWIDKGSRKVLKISAVLPSLNGAVLTEDLTPKNVSSYDFFTQSGLAFLTPIHFNSSTSLPDFSPLA